mgnify:FL=1
MPNIRSQRLDSTGIEIVASDGRTFSATMLAIRTFFMAQTGTPPTKALKTLNWLGANIQNALGAEQVPASSLIVVVESLDGRVSSLGTIM